MRAKAKPKRRRIATLDGLLNAIKQQLGAEAEVSAALHLREHFSVCSSLKYAYWSCGAEVTDRDGYRLKADVYVCDSAEQALDKLMVQLAVEARKARADAASARALEAKSTPKLAAPRQPLLLGYSGK